ncbi:MAG TPA: glycerol-3-phosphate 1-O-acyltransferase PlsY [Tenuifilaceae bacterium]|jgi:glycerol-3-phosphate acyltransferase PlsY|nr:glycerol-3-phosphate 1-O-acyltransferase PlsY [Bacteroidales bacterium]HNT42343.1 glycerol-3-phosphate 1-O-acyltransferase PlsY [Tenuifilaceae bacterium]MBP8643601.1 glycerol-3-phosphate 1-O-acyltransferase PlsY [Bacteroidales bacterium]NLI87453.1 glycerol-3-phosphate 1-O-acyltransferase PlsY [Bacteroidales bacterium]HNY08902.1 glycerol-3-phosphate 1-O-acyltransferase PlsY [Tenuifilaceae bacterium]
MEILSKIAIVFLAYLMGSIPTSVWVGKIFYGVDVREHGSGNAGATNTIRVLGLLPGIVVFIVDVLKGYLAVRLLYLTDFYIPKTGMFINFQLILGIAAMIGHIFPIFAQFRGGKGVAVLSGVVFALHPYATLIVFGIWIVSVIITGYVSLSSMIAGFSFPLILIFVYRTTNPSLILFAFILAILMLFTHQKNIERLFKGEESKFHLKKKPHNEPDKPK